VDGIQLSSHGSSKLDHAPILLTAVVREVDEESEVMVYRGIHRTAPEDLADQRGCAGFVGSPCDGGFMGGPEAAGVTC
jgi:hypothetical protein